MMKKIYTFLFFMLSALSFKVNAQDHHFSQFFNAPIYLNPSLTGQFDGDLRLNMIYRNQWTGLNGDLSYLNASADVYVPKLAGGLGLSFNKSSEGTTFLNKNNIAATYAYSVGGDDFTASFGLQVGFTNRTIDWSKLVFADQIDRRLGYVPGSASAAIPLDISNQFYFDPAAGANFVYRNAMFGAALFHINQPNESFTGVEAKLPMRLSINASFKVPLNYGVHYSDTDGAFLIPSVVYHKQGNVGSISAGAQFKYKGFNSGLWYRTNQAGERDAIVFSLIFDVFLKRNDSEKIRVGLSHDATVSSINYGNTGGSTEASFGYEKYWLNSNRTKQYNGLRCSNFY